MLSWSAGGRKCRMGFRHASKGAAIEVPLQSAGSPYVVSNTNDGRALAASA